MNLCLDKIKARFSAVYERDQFGLISMSIIE